MKFLRLGEIPPNKKSINFLKLTFAQNEDFSFDLEMGCVDSAFNSIPEDAFEEGLSVFKINEDEMPILENIQLIDSFLQRLESATYIVYGDIVGTGNDGEPLINVNSFEKIEINKYKAIEYVINVLKANFKECEYHPDKDFKDNTLNRNYRELKINKLTGEKISKWAEVENDNEYDDLPGFEEFSLNGWTFSKPFNGFDTHMGFKEKEVKDERITIRKKTR